MSNLLTEQLRLSIEHQRAMNMEREKSERYRAALMQIRGLALAWWGRLQPDSLDNQHLERIMAIADEATKAR